MIIMAKSRPLTDGGDRYQRPPDTVEYCLETVVVVMLRYINNYGAQQECKSKNKTQFKPGPEA